MSCLPEWTYSIYLDGELDNAEKRRVESHLVGCQACRRLIVALREEAELVGDSLHEREPASLRQKAVAPVRGLALGGFPTLAAIAVASVVVGGILETRLPSYAEWLNPMRLLGAYDMAFDVVFWIRDEVPGLVEFAVAAVALASVATLLSFAVSALSRRWFGSAGLLAALLLALSLPSSARALLVLHDQESFQVESGEVVSDTVVVSGESVRIDGVVDGDLLVMAERLIIRGEVRGNLFAGARSIELSGKVQGSMYAFSDRIHVRGEVARNILTGAEEYSLDESAQVGGDAIHFGENVTIQGKVARDLYGLADWIELGGSVERNLHAFAERVTLLDSAQVGGDLHARMPRGRQAQISPTARIGGEAKSEEIIHDRGWRFLTIAFWITVLLHIAAAFALGAVLRMLLPTILHAELATSGDFFRSLGIGFLALVATPIALCCLAVTLAGIPLALIGFALYLSALYIATIVVAAVIGRSLLRSREEPGEAKTMVGGSLASLLLGVVVVVTAAHIPFLGPLFGIVIVLTGLGLLVQHAHTSWRLAHA